ncbi:hypothetical protein BU25DRAFT_406286 [Macroventuria anomochaeta]|uniref:Uncharacterized protein n=1 Tax=Macroventuria anomochaeta TaxID=301207 RepID=A0ACB6SGC7_9PLEO|nr:uncharacterized protein BU25DRAFT_406286 [Macroventuria anomochaeta]KAF2633017.1 hypothetical protein BU25DRAFT_406286 [Macroventuria anomochaeta]
MASRMPPPKNLGRSFDTRYNGIFKKSTDFCEMFPDARVLIVIKKPGIQPLVFSSEQHGLGWPSAIEEYIKTSEAIVKRPAHYQSLNEGISKGRAMLVRSSLSPSPPERNTTKRTLDWIEACEDDSTLDGSMSTSPLPASKRRALDYTSPRSNRNASPFPTFILPSESRPASERSTCDAV